MNRREFITLLGGATATGPLAARAQQDGTKRQITVWMGRANDAEGQRHAAAFREALQALGWADRRNVQVHYHWVTGDIDRARLAREVVEQKPDLIVAETTVAVAALAGESRDPDRLRQCFRSGRQRVCRQPGPSRRVDHRIHVE